MRTCHAVFAARILAAALAIGAAALAGCGSPPDTTDEIGVTLVKFPNGQRIQAETMRTQIELLKGLMFRESLPEGRGMLFIHPEEDIFHYWMYQTKIPLDIIWMDHDHRIVEMSLNTPPCTSKSAKECPNYGGNFKSKFVLEVNAGVAAKNGLKTGDVLDF
jgi:uncharacterized membrane protein (UPF0127 family)